MSPRQSDRGDGATGREGRQSDGFDRWVRRQLHQLYDPVTDEPIPERLADLLDRFPTKPKPERDDEPSGGRHG
ncbi:MAG: hypothetical protein EA356_06315 [Geminicoccaceae bacterium]|nr:MAG: hypothetical protein EA356_06315 [Geminicoccaceae bacterium]